MSSPTIPTARTTRSMARQQADPDQDRMDLDEDADAVDLVQPGVGDSDPGATDVEGPPDLRIVSWNMQKQGVEAGMNAGKLFRMLDDVGANVFIAQEPPRYLSGMTAPRSGRGASSGWTAVPVQGGTQGTIVVATKNGEASCTQPGRLSSPQLGQGTRRIVEDNPIVHFSVHGQSSAVSLATFHAPYDSSIRQQYVKKAMDIAYEAKVDAVMGDFNTYGIDNPHRLRGGGGFELKLASPTSGVGKNAKGGSSPLDKIVAGPRFARARCGRVVPKRGAARPARGAPGGPSVQDITMAAWPDSRSVPSDHLPIYMDVGPGGGVKRAARADPKGQRPAKRPRTEPQ